ncbi:hypothetical protein B9Z19DRAFT_1137337 [Tuber borchii]|uniref:Uncharacterized protein n=1 Tax=Tuber borchii TaxID=42251 RepID=A0A2T6ZAK4_TUBBO|nr:hypothetical protein B9Z19DRAFT_1137337 [Tuber borchii]
MRGVESEEVKKRDDLEVRGAGRHIFEGETNGYPKNVIWDCVNEREAAGKGRDAVSFQFSLIGDDPGAAQLLIDQDPGLGEYIDVFPVEFDLKHQLEEDKWFVLRKILLGAILPKWGQQDYYNYTQDKCCLANKGGVPKAVILNPTGRRDISWKDNDKLEFSGFEI